MAIKICPKCNGKVSSTREDCPHCGFVFEANKQCPECDEFVPLESKECPVCGYYFEDVKKEDNSTLILPKKINLTNNDTKKEEEFTKIDETKEEKVEEVKEEIKETSTDEPVSDQEVAVTPIEVKQTIDNNIIEDNKNIPSVVNVSSNQVSNKDNSNNLTCPFCNSNTPYMIGLNFYMCMTCRMKYTDLVSTSSYYVPPKKEVVSQASSLPKEANQTEPKALSDTKPLDDKLEKVKETKEKPAKPEKETKIKKEKEAIDDSNSRYVLFTVLHLFLLFFMYSIIITPIGTGLSLLHFSFFDSVRIALPTIVFIISLCISVATIIVAKKLDKLSYILILINLSLFILSNIVSSEIFFDYIRKYNISMKYINLILCPITLLLFIPILIMFIKRKHIKSYLISFISTAVTLFGLMLFVIISLATVVDNKKTIKYNISGGSSAYVSEIGKDVKNAKIKSSYKGVDVTFITGSAAYSNEKLKSVYMPDTITEIHNYAFEYCINLNNVRISNNLIHIGDSAFYGCSSLDFLSLPDSLEYIGVGAFRGCNNIRISDFPEKLRRIEKDAFSCCYALDKITLPDSLEYLGGSAFEACYGLTGVSLPESIINIPYNAFAYCVKLESVYLPDSLISIDKGAFSGCKSLKTINLPRSLVRINDYVFYECWDLTEINYAGTISEWENIYLGTYWREQSSIRKIICTDGTIDV